MINYKVFLFDRFVFTVSIFSEWIYINGVRYINPRFTLHQRLLNAWHSVEQHVIDAYVDHGVRHSEHAYLLRADVLNTL